MRHRIAALIVSLGAALSVSSAFAADPQDVVQQVYAEPSLAFGGPGSQAVLATDLESAIRARTSRSPGVSPVDFDYRYGFKDTEISGFMLISQIDNDTAKVVAVFKNFGKAESVDWTLCMTPGGDWRIADASSNSDSTAWDLRQILGLRPDQVRC
jgi:hypothetical protein